MSDIAFDARPDRRRPGGAAPPTARRPITRTVVGAILALTSLAGVALRPAAAAPARRRPDTPQPRIVNGVTTQAYPSVGELLYSGGVAPITLDNASLICSATLIGCRTVLTAAHCVSDPDPSHYAVFLQHAGVFPVIAVARNPSYSDVTFPLFDVAVLKLAEPATGIAPTAITQRDPLPFIPTAGTLVGFGNTSGEGDDHGIKRTGGVHTAACPPGLPADATDADVVCWYFSPPFGPPGEDSNTCRGDSGGPLLLDLGDGPAVVGTTSGGTGVDCLDEASYDANTFAHRDFITARLATDPLATCGGLPPAEDARNQHGGGTGQLTAAAPAANYSIVVPPGANSLRVTLNREETGGFDAALYVKAGSGAGPQNFDCASVHRGPVESCVIDHPTAATWSLQALRSSGEGTYQLTATVFGGDPPQCGNAVAEVGEACDGADALRCAGLCRSDCTCPAPVCGNGVIETGEACDTTDADACPDACTSTCSCLATNVTSIACGDTLNGVLEPTDPVLDDGTWVDEYALSISQTTRLTVDIDAEFFAGYALVLDAAGLVVAQGATPLAVSVLPGPYTVLANNLAVLPDGGYPYAITVGCESRAAVPVDCGSRVAGALDPLDPLLSDGTWAEPYALTLDAPGERTFAVETTGFEGYVFVYSPDGVVVANGRTPLGASLAAGSYLVAANSFAPLADGSYPYTFAVSCSATAGCAGDCNDDRQVAIGELVRAVGIALGSTPLFDCAAADANGDGTVTVADLVLAVSSALNGCPA